ncbi:hypothetical protein BJV82DRAFT_717759 [Fennellomyces sp. T-0311]|nr:hypothetical protein BJV82DRAFT_717759 [Fennellomyces sp. T-0311]
MISTMKNSITRTIVSRAQTRRTMSAFSNMADNDPDVLETEKAKLLKFKNIWNEKLASHSEAVIKAERSDEQPMDKLQQNSVEELLKEEDGGQVYEGRVYHATSTVSKQ